VNRLKLLVATGNPGKAREFREMLGADRFEWVDLHSCGPAPDVEETGRTFLANACLKASSYARHFNTWSLADDSGLEVDALGKAPGVLSARWAEVNGAGRGDADNNSFLLKQLEHISPNHRAGRFVCVLALARADGRVVAAVRDSIEGQILCTPRGTNGFGYDPLFLVPQLGRTTAELSPDEKHRISHRGKALAKLRRLMDRLTLAG